MFKRATTPFIASFDDRSVRLRATVRADAVQAGPVPLRVRSAVLAPDRLVEVFVRPHRIQLLSSAEEDDNVLDGSVPPVDYTGEVVQSLVHTAFSPVPRSTGTADGA